MTDDRDEQVKRLAGVLTLGDENFRYAQRLYDAGVRFPEPPAPTLPIVSDLAVKAYCVIRSKAKAAPSSPMEANKQNREDALRAAYAVMVTDAVNGLANHGIVTITGTMDDVRTWRGKGDGALECAGVSADLLISLLLRGAP